MLQIKRLIIIFLVLFCCCSKSSSDEKRYRTAVTGLDIYADPKNRYVGQEIGTVPFKGRVEIVDNNEVKIDDYSFIKIKYNDVVGYVYSARLSERSDMPFVDNVKYDYDCNEFAYDKERVIYLAKESMLKYDVSEESLTNKYYIDDPQIYSFYGKDYVGEDAKYILVIMISKLHKDFNRYTVFVIFNNKNEYHLNASGRSSFTNKDGTEKVKDCIELLKSGDEFLII